MFNSEESTGNKIWQAIVRLFQKKFCSKEKIAIFGSLSHQVVDGRWEGNTGSESSSHRLGCNCD